MFKLFLLNVKSQKQEKHLGSEVLFLYLIVGDYYFNPLRLLITESKTYQIMMSGNA